MQALLPESRVPLSVHQGRVFPHFLGAQDHPWLRRVVEEIERFVGHRQRELARRLLEPFPFAAPSTKLGAATHVLVRLWSQRQEAIVPPRHARAAVFGAAAHSQADPAQVIAEVASCLRVSEAGLRASLFADLPGEKLVGPCPDGLSPVELAPRINLAIAQSLLFRSSGVQIDIVGNARVIVRQAKLRGLICTVAPRGSEGDASLEISGPYALFRRTQLYGRSLGQLLPLLAWCDRFRLRANCFVRDQELTLELGSGDPVFPAREPRRFDSQLEERFARDFRRAAPDWDIVREPEPVMAGRAMIFPDFAIQHRVDGRRWLIEIVGFWTPEYVARKLAQYRAARLARFILFVDETRSCAGEALPTGAIVIPFRRKIDAGAVLQVISRGQEPGP